MRTAWKSEKPYKRRDEQNWSRISPCVLSSPKSWLSLREPTCFWKGVFNICELSLSD